MRNAANEQITVPNGEVLRDHVVNYSPAARTGQLGFTVSVTIGYDVGWRTVEQLLLEAAEATPGVSSDFPAIVPQRTFEDFGVSYLLAAKTSGPPPLGPIRDALGRNVLDAFDRAGVELLTPGVSELRGGEPVAFTAAGSGALEDRPAAPTVSPRDEDQAT